MDQPGATGDNLLAVLGAFLDAQRNGNLDTLKALLHKDIVWEGPIPGTRCDGRRQAMQFMRRRFGGDRRMRFARLEAVEDGDRVIVTAQGPDFHPGGDAGPEGELYLVFTLRDARVVRMQGVATREEAFAGSGSEA